MSNFFTWRKTLQLWDSTLEAQHYTRKQGQRQDNFYGKDKIIYVWEMSLAPITQRSLPYGTTGETTQTRGDCTNPHCKMGERKKTGVNTNSSKNMKYGNGKAAEKQLLSNCSTTLASRTAQGLLTAQPISSPLFIGQFVSLDDYNNQRLSLCDHQRVTVTKS